MRLWLVLGFGLIAAACSPNEAASVDDCKDRSQCLNFASNEDDHRLGDALGGSHDASDDGFRGGLGGVSDGGATGSANASDGAADDAPVDVGPVGVGAVQQLIDDAMQGKLSAEALAAALDSGQVQRHHIEQGYSSDELLALVRQQLRPAYASTADECRVLGVGSRPCGGPERFIVYSTANTNESVLLELVGAYNRNRMADDAREGLVSNCRVIPKPAVVLQDGICRAARTAFM